MDNEHYANWDDYDDRLANIPQVVDVYSEDEDDEIEVIDRAEPILQKPYDPTDAPDPAPILARIAAFKKATIVVAEYEEDAIDDHAVAEREGALQIDPTEVPDPQSPKLLALMAAVTALRVKPEPSAKADEEEVPAVSFGVAEDAFFASEPKVEETPKRGWLGRLADKIAKKIDRGMEALGTALDYIVPAGSMATLAALGSLGFSTISNYENVAAASESADRSVLVQTASSPSVSIAMTKASVDAPSKGDTFEVKTTPNTLWSVKPEPAALNTLLVEKNQEIVHHAGGAKANYLFSSAAYTHFIHELNKPSRGFTAILAHPEVAKAKNIAEMVNLVEQYFGESVADLVESNAAAMHLSTGAIQQISSAY